MRGRRTGEQGELAWIEQLRRRSGTASGAVQLGIGDDCALLRVPPGEEIAVTTDFSLETTHFRRDWHSPESAGHRCLARGLSDLAAMGARPLAAFLSLALPPELMRRVRGMDSWGERFLAGLMALADTHGVPLAGGDTAGSPMISGSKTGLALADIVLIGSVPKGKAMLRSAARAGDAIYVTGALGGAAAELKLLAEKPRRFRNAEPDLKQEINPHPHLFPEPRVAAGLRLRAIQGKERFAAIDVSDGLSSDLRHLCEESKLGAEIEAEMIPVHPLAAKSGEGLELALHGGEDYELLFTAPVEARIAKSIGGVPVTRIGRMLDRKRGRPVMTLIGADGKRAELKAGGWEHFSGRESNGRGR